MIRRPPRSTLFPTRRSSDLLGIARRRGVGRRRQVALARRRRALGAGDRRGPRRARHLGQRRSEEHTSELQSLRHLVCRLLLEKKKNKKKHIRFKQTADEL